MRAFWAILGVLLLLAAGYILVGRESSSGDAAPRAERPPAAQPAMPAPVVRPSEDPGPAVAAGGSVATSEAEEFEAAQVASPAPEHTDEALAAETEAGDITQPEALATASSGAASEPDSVEAVEEPEPKTAHAAEESEGSQPAEVVQTAEKSGEGDQVAQVPEEGDTGSTTEDETELSAIASGEEQSSTEGEAAPAASIEPAPATGTTGTAEKDSAEPAVVAPEPASRGEPELAGEPVGDKDWLVRREDGTLVADGRYLIRGKGTKEEPYKISWEHLISAEEEYVPREGRTNIPKRIQMLDGKHVEITGYVAFPLLMDSADELLVMLNQWDGCCLGVPPTPYDAVEVILADVIRGNARMATYGTVRGTFKVDPHLVGGWLVGLYLLEDARLEPLAFGGFAP